MLKNGYLTKSEEQKVREIKNHLHENPELSWEEKRTAEYIREKLKEIEGVELVECSVPNAVLARIKGVREGLAVALRADMDAIRTTEQWESEHMSRTPEIAHACGHDFHMAALIGAAMILGRNRERLFGDAVLLFQPAEETTSGAVRILEAGILKSLGVGMVFGLHNRPEILTGRVAVQPGPLMAAKKNFRLTIFGQGGHGSMPHKCVDPIVCAAAVVQAVQTIVSRNTDPQEALVLAIGSIHGGTVENLVVDRVEMTGSMRYFSEEVGLCAIQRLEQIIRSVADAYDCRGEIVYEEQVPAVRNPEALVRVAHKAAEAAMGEQAAVTARPCLASEDFARYQEKTPGFFYWLGVGEEGEHCYSWHHAKFHTDDRALKHGASLLAWSASEGLKELFIM